MFRALQPEIKNCKSTLSIRNKEYFMSYTVKRKKVLEQFIRELFVTYNRMFKLN